MAVPKSHTYILEEFLSSVNFYLYMLKFYRKARIGIGKARIIIIYITSNITSRNHRFRCDRTPAHTSLEVLAWAWAEFIYS
jgi:hypothetical protein